VLRGDAYASLFRQGFQQRRVDGMAEYQRWWRRHAQVMLRNEGFQHLPLHRRPVGALVRLVGR